MLFPSVSMDGRLHAVVSARPGRGLELVEVARKRGVGASPVSRLDVRGGPLVAGGGVDGSWLTRAAPGSGVAVTMSDRWWSAGDLLAAMALRMVAWDEALRAGDVDATPFAQVVHVAGPWTLAEVGVAAANAEVGWTAGTAVSLATGDLIDALSPGPFGSRPVVSGQAGMLEALLKDTFGVSRHVWLGANAAGLRQFITAVLCQSPLVDTARALEHSPVLPPAQPLAHAPLPVTTPVGTSTPAPRTARAAVPAAASTAVRSR